MRAITSHRRLGFSLAVLVAAAAVALPSVAPAQAATSGATRTSGFIPFPSFLAQLRTASFASARKDDASLAQSSSGFAQTKSYLEHLYRGVDVRESFITNGSYFDCVTVTSQPTVNALGIKRIAQAPPASKATPAVAGDARPWTTTGRNQQGRVVSCPTGTVPMHRTTLQQVASYPTLHDFLAKGGTGAVAGDTPGYRHAYGYDEVANDGGSSVLNVWDPKVPTSNTGDDHSLSQQWIIGGSGASTQTAEGGWDVDPGLFSTTLPAYFVYWTANDYVSTGCYNLDCAGFVQTNNSVALGAAVTPCCSTKGAVNDSFTQEYEMYQGAWWIAINGTFIGYFPVSVYNGGQMSKNSTDIEFGGEVFSNVTTKNWPQMGSGAFASAGHLKAAYQSSIEYFGLTLTAFWASLTTQVTGAGATPSSCYSLKYTPVKGKTGPHFFYGGPGGKQAKC